MSPGENGPWLRGKQRPFNAPVNDIGNLYYNRDVTFFLHYRIFITKMFVGDFEMLMGDFIMNAGIQLPRYGEQACRCPVTKRRPHARS
jgi:hypothetical protein